MNENKQPRAKAPDHGASEIASELNNVLQIISGTSAMLENIWDGRPGAEKYFSMMRESIARAAEVTAHMVELSGSIGRKIVLHPEFGRMRAKKAAQRTAPKERIMVVDDEPMLLAVMAEVLREEGYEVVTAKSGFECLDYQRSSRRQFDLVVLDLNMPMMDGEETFGRLRATDRNMRVMLCTGFVPPDRLNRMVQAGLCGFVQKPLTPTEYLASVRAALDGVPFAPAARAEEAVAT